MTSNLFPLPYWAPALRRVPIPLQVLNEAYLRGKRARMTVTASILPPPERGRAGVGVKHAANRNENPHPAR